MLMFQVSSFKFQVSSKKQRRRRDRESRNLQLETYREEHFSGTDVRTYDCFRTFCKTSWCECMPLSYEQSPGSKSRSGKEMERWRTEGAGTPWTKLSQSIFLLVFFSSSHKKNRFLPTRNKTANNKPNAFIWHLGLFLDEECRCLRPAECKLNAFGNKSSKRTRGLDKVGRHIPSGLQ